LLDQINNAEAMSSQNTGTVRLSPTSLELIDQRADVIQEEPEENPVDQEEKFKEILEKTAGLR
jgi:hypothetical protein